MGVTLTQGGSPRGSFFTGAACADTMVKRGMSDCSPFREPPKDGFLDDEHPDTLDSLNNLANSLHCKDENSALPLYEECLARRKRVLGEDHPTRLHRSTILPTFIGAKPTGTARCRFTRSAWRFRSACLATNTPTRLCRWTQLQTLCAARANTTARCLFTRSALRSGRPSLAAIIPPHSIR